MFNSKIKLICLSVLLKIKYLFWIFTGTFALSQHFENQTIRVHFDKKNPEILHVEQVFRLKKTISTGDTLAFYNYLNGYQNIHSDLGKSIAGHYRLEFHFSKRKERAQINFRKNPSYEIIEAENFFKIKTKTETDSINLHYIIKLPHAKFTGLGYDKGTYHLLDFFVQPLVYHQNKTLTYTNKNLDDRPVLPIKTRIELHNPPKNLSWNSNGKTTSNDTIIYIEHPNNKLEIIGTKNPFEKYKINNHILVLEYGLHDLKTLDMVQIWEDIFKFLEKEQIPVATKILITKRDLKNNPVYGAEWIPVINNFPGKFIIQINFLKQILYKSGRELLIDPRKNHSLINGLWQFYIMKFIEQYYPEMRLTGNKIQIPVLRNYYLFNVPYTEKFKLTYLYMARMNRDQAIALPSDSLTLFNRKVTAPYKAALGWKFMEKYTGKTTFRTAIHTWLTKATKENTDLTELQHLFEPGQKEKIKFLFSDYYLTSKKTDWKIKKSKNSKLALINKTRMNTPVTVEILRENQIEKKLFASNENTTINLPDNFKFITVNADNPLPEIWTKDNIYPAGKRPLKIRFFMDLEDPYAYQLFFNPDLDYNLYDGIIIGMGLNNKSIPDKAFTWELTPEYGLKSRFLGGTAQFHMKKHFVRPYLHGLSAGGYYKSFHYAPGKTYLTYSLYATLSHKNRREKFFKENDLSAEWLYVFKQSDTPTEFTRYGIFMIRNQYQHRDLLKQTIWKSRAEFHPKFIKLQTDFRFRSFIDKYRQLEWRIFAGWMPYNQTATDYFSFALSRPTDYLFKYNYYGRSETSGIFYQQYIYAEGSFKVFYPDQFANSWMITNNVYVGIWKRFNLFIDFGWMQSLSQPVRFHYDAGLRYYLVPDFFELYFPFLYDDQWIKFDKNYPQYIRIMFVFDLPNLFKMFTRSWY